MDEAICTKYNIAHVKTFIEQNGFDAFRNAESETLIHQTLKEFVKGRTVMLITHTMSASLLDFVTRIVVMDQGQVVADGTHAQLLAVSPMYQRFFQAPSRREAA